MSNSRIIEDKELGLVVEIINLHEDRKKESEYREKGSYFYVGRGTYLGNGFSFKPSKYEVARVSTREESIEKYKEWIYEKVLYNTNQNNCIELLVDRLVSQKHIVLGCFCVPLQCHAEIIAEIVLKRAKERTEKMKELFDGN